MLLTVGIRDCLHCQDRARFPFWLRFLGVPPADGVQIHGVLSLPWSHSPVGFFASLLCRTFSVSPCQWYESLYTSKAWTSPFLVPLKHLNHFQIGWVERTNGVLYLTMYYKAAVGDLYSGTPGTLSPLGRAVCIIQPHLFPLIGTRGTDLCPDWPPAHLYHSSLMSLSLYP